MARDTVDLSQRDSLARLAYNQLRDEIISGLWKPGEKISIRQEAERFCISVTPVREAMLQLAAEQTLRLEPRSFSIPVLTKEEFLEIRKIRSALEHLLTLEAVQRPDPTLADTLDAIHNRLIAAKQAGDFRTVMIENRRFHFTLYDKADLPQACAMVKTLWARSGPYQHSLYLKHPAVDPATHDHLRVCRAVAVGDANEAAAAIVEDITLRGVRLEDRHYSTFDDALQSSSVWEKQRTAGAQSGYS